MRVCANLVYSVYFCSTSGRAFEPDTKLAIYRPSAINHVFGHIHDNGWPSKFGKLTAKILV